MSESNFKLINVDGIEYKCVFRYGYNDHTYGGVYQNEMGKYIGQIEDIRMGDSDVVSRVTEFVKKNVF